MKKRPLRPFFAFGFPTRDRKEVGLPMRMVTVASPAYLKRYGVPERPEELMTHR